MATLDVEPMELAPYAQSRTVDGMPRLQAMATGPLVTWLRVPASAGSDCPAPTGRGESHLFSVAAVLPSPGCHGMGSDRKWALGSRFFHLEKCTEVWSTPCEGQHGPSCPMNDPTVGTWCCWRHLSSSRVLILIEDEFPVHLGKCISLTVDMYTSGD